MPLPSTLSTKVGDGFTFGEANEVRHHTLQSWEPREQYKNTQISKLVPGSGRVCLLGRVVNLYEPPPPNNMPSTAKGCFKLHVRDDSGTLMVCILYKQSDALSMLCRSGYGLQRLIICSDSANWFRSGRPRRRASLMSTLPRATILRHRPYLVRLQSFQSATKAAISWLRRA